MNRRAAHCWASQQWHTIYITLLVLLAFLAGAANAAPPRALLPNIVIILADDLGYGDPHCYNNESKIPTPHIDALAREGLRFTDAHTPSAVCTPTRYGLLTGRYCWRTRLKSGVLNGSSRLLIEPERMTVASLLKNKGYRTACVGKWHLGLSNHEPVDMKQPLAPGPNAVGFDSFFGIAASLDMPPYAWIADEQFTVAPTGSIQKGDNNGAFWRPGAIAPGFTHESVLPELTAKAVSVIDETAKAKSGKPLFLYMPLTSPHTPWVPTEKFRGRSKAGTYGDFVTEVDWAVGEVVAALKSAGMFDNTLLIFTSDNGAHWTPKQIAETEHRANGPWRGQKADIWEGGHRVPLIVRWPGAVPPGSTSSQLVCLTDILATCADIVGEKLPASAGEDSVSILPALKEPQRAAPLREALVMHSISGMFAVRQGSWKLILGSGSGGFSTSSGKQQTEAGQLYNLANDPTEANNVYNGHPNVVERLTALLTKYRQEGRSSK